METGPHEEAAYATEETGEELSDVPSTHSPTEDIEETAKDDEDARQPKWAWHNIGDSASASSLAKHVSNPEMDDTGSSSSSAKEQAALENPLTMEPLSSAPPSEFHWLPSVSFASSEEKLR